MELVSKLFDTPSYVIQVLWLLASKLASKQPQNLYDIYLKLYVQSWTPDDGRRDRPKHVEWYSINSKNCSFSWFYYRNKILASGYFLGQFYSPFTLIIYLSFYALLHSDSKRQLKVVHSSAFVFNLSFPSTPRSSNFSVPYRFSYQALYTPLIPPTLHTPLFSHSVTLTIYI